MRPRFGAVNDRHLLRIGGLAAVTGAVAQFVATVLEPDWGGAPDKAARVVAGSGFWTGDKLLDLIGVLLTVGALTLVGRTLGERGREWARLGQPLLVLMGALGASATAVGANLKHLANAWIAAGPAAGRPYLTAFDATARVTEALFFCAFLALGLYLATLAVAILSGRTYARWIGRAAAVSAVLVVAGDLLELVVDAAFVAVVVGFVVFLAVLIALGVSLWRRAQVNRGQLPRRQQSDRTNEDSDLGGEDDVPARIPDGRGVAAPGWIDRGAGDGGPARTRA
jgi:hypothetical protein